MPSDLEQLILGERDLNDQVTFSMEELVFVSAEKKAKWAESPNADGPVLVEESHYGSAFFEATIRVIPAKDTDAALAALGTLMDALQGCERHDGGTPTEWTPNEATRTYTAYALLAELLELPITVDGELAGWFVESPVVKVKLTCRPFLHTEERVVLAPVEAKGPLQVVHIPDIGGDVPAEGRLVLTDKAAQERRYVEFGQDLVESEESALLFEADKDLTVEGLAGKLVELSGSISTKVVSVTLSQTPIALCSTGPIDDIGSFRLKARCQVDGTGAYFRASYRGGDGSWTSLPWVSITGDNNFFVIDDWFELDLREAFLEEVEKGEQISEVRIEGKIEAANCTGYADILTMMPTRRYGVVRAPLGFGSPTALLIADSFSQPGSGAATGQTADVGGKYAAAAKSDTTDFTISEGRLVRTAVSDTGTLDAANVLKGRAIGVPVELTDFAASMDFTLEGEANHRFGFLIGYAGTESFTSVTIYLDTFLGWTLWVAGYNTSSWGLFRGITTPLVPANTVGQLVVVVSGEALTVYVAGSNGVLQREGTVEHASVGTKGTVLVYDENANAAASTRYYDNLAVWKPEFLPVCTASQSVEIRTDAVERENAGGTFWSPVPEYRGAGFYLDPAGEEGLINRLVVKMRRNDLKLEPDSSSGVEEKQALEVLARERFLIPR